MPAARLAAVLCCVCLADSNSSSATAAQRCAAHPAAPQTHGACQTGAAYPAAVYAMQPNSTGDPGSGQTMLPQPPRRTWQPPQIRGACPADRACPASPPSSDLGSANAHPCSCTQDEQGASAAAASGEAHGPAGATRTAGVVVELGWEAQSGKFKQSWLAAPREQCTGILTPSTSHCCHQLHQLRART